MKQLPDVVQQLGTALIKRSLNIYIWETTGAVFITGLHRLPAMGCKFTHLQVPSGISLTIVYYIQYIIFTINKDCDPTRSHSGRGWGSCGIKTKGNPCLAFGAKEGVAPEGV